jgi:hypothetical protein
MADTPLYEFHFLKATSEMKKLITNNTNLAVHFDKPFQYRANAFFNVIPAGTELLALYPHGSLRRYLVNIRYYYRRDGYSKHQNLDPLMNMSERLQRIFANDPDPENSEVTFSTTETKFNMNVEYWNLIREYRYHNGLINNINYNPVFSDQEEAIPSLGILEFDTSFDYYEVFSTKTLN